MAKVDLIVTNNLRDFPLTALTPFGLVAQSPDRFLNLLFDADADRMTGVLRGLASSYQTPAMSFDTFLARLAKHAPSLVTRLMGAAR